MEKIKLGVIYLEYNQLKMMFQFLPFMIKLSGTKALTLL